MTLATTEWTTDEERESREDEEEDGLRVADASLATAEQFQITDTQHWIDLCA